MKQNQKSQNYIFTYNNPKKDNINDIEQFLKNCQDKFEGSYVAGQLEKGKEGTEHVQFLIHFKSKRHFSAVKKDFPSCHIEQIKSLENSINYVIKEDSRIQGPYEFGIRPRISKKGRDKLTMGDIDKILDRDYVKTLTPFAFNSAVKARNTYTLLFGEPYCGIRHCMWITGVPGVGKSRYVEHLGPYKKALNKWWDGYQGEPVVLIDDFELDSLRYLDHYLKIWADRYSIRGEIKGGTIPLQYTHLYVTSNYTIRETVQAISKRTGDGRIVLDEQLLLALKRRFTEVVVRSFELIDGSTWALVPEDM